MKNPFFHLEKKFCVVLIMSALFALAYMQMPLYSSNQNAYFLHGLAKGGFGFLNLDWLAGSTDHIPMFSFIVRVTYDWGLSNLIYLFHGILVMIYFLSLLGILDRLFNLRDKKISLLFCFVILTFIHCVPIHYLIANKFSVFKSLPREMLLFTEGLAGQYILGPYFQPSAFGIFLILSIFLFLQKKEIAATVAAVIASSLHPSYLLQMALLIAIYTIIIIKDKRYKKAFLIAGLGLILILPTLVYMYLHFKPANPETFREAQSILIDYRLAHHIKPYYWFHIKALFQIFLIILGIRISRRNNKLFQVLIFLAVSSLLLTLIQLLTKNKTLALMFPWRISVILVPVSVTLLIGWIVERFSIWSKMVKLKESCTFPVCIVILALILYMSGLGFSTTISKIRSNRASPVSRYVKETMHGDDVYLVPVNWEWFRLQSGAPIFVDAKSHPYKDIDVIEWRKRMTLARAFYQSKETKEADKNLTRILYRYKITHIIVETNFPELSLISLCNILYKGDAFIIYTVNE